jgi:hypothetical protein
MGIWPILYEKCVKSGKYKMQECEVTVLLYAHTPLSHTHTHTHTRTHTWIEKKRKLSVSNFF